MKQFLFLLMSVLFAQLVFPQGGNNTLSGRKLIINGKPITQITNDTSLVVIADTNNLITEFGAKKYTDKSTGEVNLSLFNAVGNGTTNNSAILQQAIDYVADILGGGTVAITRPGTYMVGGVRLRSKVTIRGPSGVTFGQTNQAAVVLKRIVDSSAIFTANNVSGVYVHGLEFNGNNGDVNNFGNAIISGATVNSTSIVIENCKFFFFNTAIFANDDSGWRIYSCTFRNNNVGLSRLRDFDISYNNFTGNRQTAIYENNGQGRITSNFFEFTGTGGNGGVAAINIDGNSSRLQITGNIFDRNLSNDIKIASSISGKRATRINITGNQFKRAAWYDSISPDNMVSINVAACIGITIVGNDWFAASYGAASTEGVYSPMYAMTFKNTKDIKVQSNNYNSIKIKVDLQDTSAYIWINSPANANEWYLRRKTEGPQSFNPWIGKANNLPDFIGYDSAVLSSGTIGSLTAGSWAYGNNDALGFSTVYVRLTGAANPNIYGEDSGLFAYFDHRPIRIENDCSNVQTDDALDQTVGGYTTLNAGASTNFYLYTRSQTAGFRANSYFLRISGRQRNTNNLGDGTLPFSILRNTAGIASIQLAPVDAPLAQFSIGSTATDDLQFALSTDVIGTRLKVTVTNNSANIIDFSLKLR